VILITGYDGTDIDHNEINIIDLLEVIQL